MCCGKAFWKGVFVFAITFATGILIANLYALRSATTSSCPLVMKELAPEVKNCVPVDYALKYERLSADGKSHADKTKKQFKEKKPDGNAPESKDKPKIGFYDPAKDSAEYQTLLHKERCFQSDIQK